MPVLKWVSCVMLQALDFDIPALFNSDKAVAMCQSEGERLTKLISIVVAATTSTHEGTLIGGTRKWTKEHGYRFWIKRAEERILAPGEMTSPCPMAELLRLLVFSPGWVFLCGNRFPLSM